MRLSSLFVFIVAACSLAGAATIQPDVAELSFDRRFEKPDALAGAKQPAWVAKVEQQGGRFRDEPHAWEVAASAPEGVGRLSITLDRKRLNEDLVATILFDADEAADIAVQLFDAQGRAVVVDLFGNLVEVGKEATTDTFIIPLRKYPTAEKIVLRRVKGPVKVYGVVLFPVVTEGEADLPTLEKLARVLGDPLSPENPLLKGLQNIARSSKVTIQPPAASTTAVAAATPPPRGKYAAAVPPPAGLKVAPPSTEGLVAHWAFDGDTTDANGGKHNGRIRGAAPMVDGIRGKALHLRRGRMESMAVRSSPDLILRETLSVAAWIKYSSIAPRWGSQILWCGDERLGRDLWQLNLFPDGTLHLRSDRSVTGQPEFYVFENEIQFSPKGGAILSQHVGVESPKTLAPETWYFVTGTIEKLSPKQSAFKIYVNGEVAGEMRTEEVVNYDTDKMWVNIGSVDFGDWQNFDGFIDEVRIYNRALTPAEVMGLYQQPRQ